MSRGPPRRQGVCVLHIQPFFLPVDEYPATTSARADSSILFNRGVPVTWSQNDATETIHWYAVRGGDNAMPCHYTGYDMHDIHIL